MPEAHAYTIFETRNGFVALAWNARGISGLRLPASSERAAEAAVLRRLPDAERTEAPPTIAALIADIVRYFAGETIDFSQAAVDLGPQDPFFQQVYDHIRQLGWGQTTTYGAVAKALGAPPQAARDVGQAMATNPVPLIVPCHRVLAAGGRIGGFSAPGGSDSKAKMLEIEGVAVIPPEEKRAKPAPSAQIGFDF